MDSMQLYQIRLTNTWFTKMSYSSASISHQMLQGNQHLDKISYPGSFKCTWDLLSSCFLSLQGEKCEWNWHYVHALS